MMMPLAQAVLAQMRPHRNNGTKPDHDDDDQEMEKEIGASANVHEGKFRDAEKDWRALSAAVSLGIAFSAPEFRQHILPSRADCMARTQMIVPV